METRASYVVVGAFVFAMLAAAMGFTIWLGRFEFDEAKQRYQINFTGAVTGLSVGSTVRYRGVPVGQVADISINPANIEQIRVLVDIDAEVPIKADAYAILESQGLTGIGYIQIRGGTQDAPTIEPRPGQEVPLLPSRDSVIQEVFQTAPEIATQLVVLINRANEILSPENQAAFERIVGNVEIVTGTLARRSGETEALIADAALLVRELRLAAETARPLLAELQREASDTMASVRGGVAGMDAGVTRGIADLGRALARIEAAAAEAEMLIAENRTAVGDFTHDGLYEFGEFLTEGRLLLESAQRLLRQVESDPGRILFGNRNRGVEAEQ